MESRRFNLPLAELVDRLAVDQIKEVLLSKGQEDIAREMKDIEADIESIIQDREIKLSAALVRAIIALAQINLHIWHHKDLMEKEKDSDPAAYSARMILSHQINGIRNQIKNRLLSLSGEIDGATVRSNFNIDGLKGWKFSL